MRKISNYNPQKSLDELCKKYSSRIGVRFLLYTKAYQKDGEVTSVQVYYAGLM